MNKQINAQHVASLYLDEKRALNSSLWNSFFQSRWFQDLSMNLRQMSGPRVLSLEHGAKRNFTMSPGREKIMKFNHMSLGGKRKILKMFYF